MPSLIRLLSPLESMQEAWGLKLRDFRQWCAPAGQDSIRNWKTRQLKGAIVVSKTSMIDDVEEMLKSIQENDNALAVGDTSDSGTSVYLPVMVTAISAIESPPERDLIIGSANWITVVVPTDPLQRPAKLRTTPVSYRCQIAFFSPDPHGASAIANQFVNFWKDEARRSFDVYYELGYAGTSIIKDAWNFKVAENTITPDKADVGIKNIHAVTVDCVIVGLEPVVVGLGGIDDPITDTGEHDGSIPIGLPPIIGGRPDTDTEQDELNGVVIEADVIDKAHDRHTRVNADPDTGVITQSEVKL